MTLVLDTEEFAPRDRMAAVHAAFASATVPTDVALAADAPAVRARAEVWRLGAADVFQVFACGLSMRRTPGQVRSHGAEVIAVAMQRRASGRLSQGDHQWESAPGQLILVDMASPYEFSWSGDGGSIAFKLTYDEFGIDAHRVRAAVPHLAASPLYGLVAGHLRRMATNMNAIAGGPGGPAVADATAHLVRAWLASVSPDTSQARSASAEAIMPRVLAYIEEHLTDPDLAPARIAAANNISLRYLHKLCADSGFHVAEVIMRRRLEGARRDLAQPEFAAHTVAAIARRWGFSDPAHFSKRFSGAYRMPPGEWRAHSLRSSAAAGGSRRPARSSG